MSSHTQQNSINSDFNIWFQQMIQQINTTLGSMNKFNSEQPEKHGVNEIKSRFNPSAEHRPNQINDRAIQEQPIHLYDRQPQCNTHPSPLNPDFNIWLESTKKFNEQIADQLRKVAQQMQDTIPLFDQIHRSIHLYDRQPQCNTHANEATFRFDFIMERRPNENEEQPIHFKEYTKPDICAFCSQVGHRRLNCLTRKQIYRDITAIPIDFIANKFNQSRKYYHDSLGVNQQQTQAPPKRVLQQQNVHSVQSMQKDEQQSFFDEKQPTENDLIVKRLVQSPINNLSKNRNDDQISPSPLIAENSPTKNISDPTIHSHTTFGDQSKLKPPVEAQFQPKPLVRTEESKPTLTMESTVADRHCKSTKKKKSMKNPVTIASLFTIYEAPIQPKIPVERLEQNSTDLTDQSTIQMSYRHHETTNSEKFTNESNN